MRTFAFWLLGFICGFFIGGMVEDAEARYRPLVATQDEDAISCATDAQRLKGFAAAGELPGLRVIRINAMENMNPIFECDPVSVPSGSPWRLPGLNRQSPVDALSL